MSNATKRAQTTYEPFNIDAKFQVGMASTAQTYYPGALVGLNTSGYGTKMDDTAQIRFQGISAQPQTTIASGGSDGDVKLEVVQPRYITMDIASAAVTDIGRPVYATDDQTASFSPGSFGNLIGYVHSLVSSTSVRIECAWESGRRARKPHQVASASGAVVIKESTVVITKAGVAALTIADPAAADDGIEMTFISATAQAHTLSNAAGSGFNAGGAGSDVGTFGGAIGDGITIVAYNTKWLVKDKTNVTLA